MRTIFEKAAIGLPLEDVLVIDCHNHIGPWRQFHAPRNDAEGMLASMDAIGINQAFITAHAAIGPDYRYGNDLVIETLERHPDRFFGYVTVNPSYASDMERELERCLRVRGMKGIKLHPAMHGMPIDSAAYTAAYETANARRCPLLIHTWGAADMTVIDKLTRRYPDAQFIIGHAGADVRAMEEAIRIADSRDNAYLDLALSMAYEGNVEWFVSMVGSRKVVFGSDMPFYDPRPTFGRVALADISEDEKRDILGRNMERLLKMCK